MKTYKITKPIKRIHKLEIKSNVTLPYGVVMELQSEVLGWAIGNIEGMKNNQDLTKETITILKHYDNEMSDLDTTNLKVTGSIIEKWTEDENHNEVEIQGEFL